MKKVLFIFIALLLFIQNANAQYRYTVSVDTTCVKSMQQLMENPVYQNALTTERHGKTLFFTGLGCQLAGIGLCFVPSAREYCDGTCYARTQNNTGLALNIVGGICVVGGTVMEVIGICKWSAGSAQKRYMQFTLAANSIHITF